MEPARDVASSPQDQSQPTTDPLAIEPTNNNTNHQQQETHPESTSVPSEAAAVENPQDVAQQQSVSPPLQATTATPTLEVPQSIAASSPSEQRVSKEATGDSLEQQRSESEAQDKKGPSSSAEPAVVNRDSTGRPENGVNADSGTSSSSSQNSKAQSIPAEIPVPAQASSSDGSAVAIAEFSASKQLTSTNNGGAPTSSSPSVSNSNSNSSNSFLGSSSGIGVRKSVTSDNSLKINGISDLSILDVTEGNDDEIEVKVEGGSLMHKVIKFSLLNGMQDSSKRLENSRLIMSGVANAAHGEATLATTSSLCRGVLGGASIRQEDKSKEDSFKGSTLDSKTTPPACSSARPGSAEPSSSCSNSSNSSSDNNVNGSETVQMNPNRTEESNDKVRHSADSNVSGTSGNNDPVREESVSDTYCRSASLDFRERTVPSSSSRPGEHALIGSSSVLSGASLDLSKINNKETDRPSQTISPPSKRPKAMYYTGLPDFSKPIFTAPSVSAPTSSTVTSRDRGIPPTKSLSQLHMKTPDFSRIVPSAATISQSTSHSITPTPASSASITSTNSRSHELQIANPDFSKSFNPKPLQPSGQQPPKPSDRSPYMNQAAFAVISKQRNYISDLQLKNPPHQETASQSHSSVVKGPSPVQGPGLGNYRIDKSQPAQPYPPSAYRQETASHVQLEEPKAHVIHKTAASSHHPEAVKPWNPVAEYSPKPNSQTHERDRYSHQYPPTIDHKGPPPLTSEPPTHTYPGYPPYPLNRGKDPPQTTAPASHPGGIIVNNVKTYYPEPSQHPGAVKPNEAEFRLEHKEKQLRQEGTIITLKPNEARTPTGHPQNSHYSAQPYHHPPRSRSPSTERREAQMMASSQEILYRDFKLKQSYEMPPQSSASTRQPAGNRLQEEAKPRPMEPAPRDRSPYDAYYRGAPAPPPNRYYPQPQPEHIPHKQSISPASSASSSPTPPMHVQTRSPVPVPSKQSTQINTSLASGGMMHPPSNWPNQSRIVPSPHGSGSTSSPLSVPSSVSPNHFANPKNSPSPVSSYGPQSGSSHSYKSPSPSASSPAPYGGSGGSVTKYTQYYPGGGAGERVVSVEVDKETYKPGFRGLDYNMEQKFAEVYQAHQMKEKQAAAASKQMDPYKGQQQYAGPSGEYPRHGIQQHHPSHPSMQQSHPNPPSQHPGYKPMDYKPKEAYRDEYGRSRPVPGSAMHNQPHPAASAANARYTSPQENLNQYNQYCQQQRINADVEMRKAEPHLYKPISRDPSPAQPGPSYGPSESPYHPSKQSHYPPPPAQSSSAKVPHHAAYPSTPSEPPGPPSHYGLPGKSSYPSSSYERPAEKQPSVISTAYSQEREGTRTGYPESRQHPSAEHYPPGGGLQYHHPQQPQQLKASVPSQNYPPQGSGHSAYTTPPATSSRDPAWHYQQQPPPQQHQHQHQPPPASQPVPGGGYNPDRHPPARDERQNPVIQQPHISKNIPVKVIATANTAPAASFSTTVAPATSTTKRESPLDLSVKTVKTKADSTASDDYAQNSRHREVVPKVNFNPNFKKHIPGYPERPPVENRPQPQQQPPTNLQHGHPQSPYHPHLPREPQSIPPPHQHHSLQASASSSKSSPAPSPQQSDHRQAPVVSPAIPPGYDKKTDAYMSANYRAVGGPPGENRDPARYQHDNRYPPPLGSAGPSDQREPPNMYGVPPDPYTQRLPPGAVPIPQYAYQQSPSGMVPKADPYYQSGVKPVPSAASRNVYYPPHELARGGGKHPPVAQKPTTDDPRIEDRKFVESMLKKQTSPSAEVIADLQAGKFSTRIPSALAPAKKRPAETAIKPPPSTKVSRLGEPSIHRPYDNSYPPYPGPAAPREYYPAVPMKHEPASPQPAGVYYADKRSEAPPLNRGVLTTAPSHPPPSTTDEHSVLQQQHPNVEHPNTRPQTHPSVITSYQPNRPEVLRSTNESPQQRDYRQAYKPAEDHHQFPPRPEPFRDGPSDPNYSGSADKRSQGQPVDHPGQTNLHQTTTTIVMQSHIQYGGPQPQPLQPSHYKHPEVFQNSPRPDYYNSSSQPTTRPSSIMENQQCSSRSYENIPRLITTNPAKVSPEQRLTPSNIHSSMESLSQASSAPSPQHRGADQSVISKLRTSLEQKERINQLRKQTSSEMSEEDTKPSDASNSLPPSHFRSKGAMKAYTPIPAFDMQSSIPQQQQQQPQQLQDQVDPPQTIEATQPTQQQQQHSPKASDPGAEVPTDPIEPPADIEGTSALDMLDWGSACNELVEQLQTGKKRGRRKRAITSKPPPAETNDDEDPDRDAFEKELPGMVPSSAISEVPQDVLKSAAQEIGDFASSSDEDKPLHLLKQHGAPGTSTGETKEEDLQLLHAIHNSTMEKLTEKIARNMREKQRLELEQKHEAKLGRSSSSESESDTKRVVQRTKMRARKLRNRSSVPLKSSEVNTDEEDEEEDEEEKEKGDAQARDLRKRKGMERTSSESETRTHEKKKSRCQAQVKQQMNGTDLSSDEEDPKTQSPNKKTERPDAKGADAKQGARADSSDSPNCVDTKGGSVNGKKNCEAEAAGSSGTESEDSERNVKKGPKKCAKTKSATRSSSRVVEESSDSAESAVEEETMTRSKSKLELERRRSNSKVLRNDKIIENNVRERKKSESVTPQKYKKGTNNAKLEASKKRILDSDSDSKSVNTKKRTRKASKLHTTTASESSEESDAETVSERLRSRKQPKSSETSAPSSASKRGTSQDGRTPLKGAHPEKKNSKATDSSKKRGRQTKKTSKDCATENASENFYPGWEKEFYEFKRSLKIPHALITINGRKSVYRISTSLPDLDSHHSDESETFSEIVQKINQKDALAGKKARSKGASKQIPKNNHLSKEQLLVEEKQIDGNKKFTSIIEMLHERMLRHVKTSKARKTKGNHDKEPLKPKPEFELLSTPGAESEALFNRKKKSLFDTAILKSRTRTEQKVMQSKEIIREVFGGDDERPQSAPPLSCVQDIKNVTYDEMYNEMLSKSNNVATFLAQKKMQRDLALASCSGQCGSSAKVKIEDLDDETQDSVLKDSGRVTEEGDTPSVVSERDLATPVSFKGSGKKKTHKSRRKGSSGFDYIRKKKKPTVNNGENSANVIPRKKVTSVFETLETKDETHISKEIRSWVLNKGVGESVMHKAARLGYTDVIVYCLERLEMDPDLKDNAGYTPLHEACAKGHLDICNYLLQYGASHSETALSGIRPLHEAVENSFIEVVRLLLAFGADPMLATYAGQTPIQLAENNEMEHFLENHLFDIQSMSPMKTGWKMDGPWKIHDPEESGCDIFADIPGFPEATSTNLHNNSASTERSSMSCVTLQDAVESRPLCLPPPPPPLPPPPPSPLPTGAMVPQNPTKKCDSNSNIMNFEIKLESELAYERRYKDCAVVLNDIHEQNNGRTAAPPGDTTTYLNGQLRQALEVKEEVIEERAASMNGELSVRFDEETDDEGEFLFEYEEADRPLPPLYLLKDEGAGEKWMLMTDLCNVLKLKSKEAVIRQICSNSNATNLIAPNNSNPTAAPAAVASSNTAGGGATGGTNSGTRELIRELKIEDFLTRASCLQLLCAGEKLNINSNKVVLVKYNENVRNLLQVQALVTRI